MKVLILYRPDSEHGRRVEEYIHDFQSRHPAAKLETLNIDTREGSAMATVYDIVQYPAILVMRDDGTVQNIWEGDSFPLIDEVAAYSTM